MHRPISEHTLHSEIKRLLSEFDNDELPVSLVDNTLPPMVPRKVPDESFRSDGTREVLVEIRGDEVSILLFAIRWDTPYSTVSDYDLLATFNWEMMRKEALFSLLHESIEEAFRIRRTGFQHCTDCGEINPPESWGEIDGKPVCHGCMMARGIVF